MGRSPNYVRNSNILIPEKVSGTKLELVAKACNHVKLVHGLSISLEENDEQGRYNNTDDKYKIPEIVDLNSGLALITVNGTTFVTRIH
jgi:hypothetical protein